MPNRAERAFETTLFRARWLMAPMYLGLIVSLVLLIVVFLREIALLVPKALELTVEKAILSSLTLIDLTLAANLLLIVLFSGYENFISRMDLDDATDRPAWMGKVDFGGLKIKLIASIVAISAISLLKRFMEIGSGARPLEPAELRWLVIIHLTFVVSGVLMALMDWLNAQGAKSSGKGG